MSLRIRKDGRVLCAALNPPKPGDIYIDDPLHHHLFQVARVLTTSPEPLHSATGGEWFWAKP